VSDGIRKQLSDAASIVTLPAALTRNVQRATEALIDIRDQLGSLVDLPGEILDQLRAMQELAEQMNQTAKELHAIAGPMLETAQGIHELAGPMLEAAEGIRELGKPLLDTGDRATAAAEQARDAVQRTNELIEETLKLAAPVARVTERAEGLRARLRGERPKPADTSSETDRA
jgi:methyl-accepting chemotaxis protein